MTVYTVVLIIHGFAALFGLGTIVVLALKHASFYQKMLTVTSICCFLGLVAYLMELMSESLREALLAARFGYIGKSYVMMLFLIFMAKYCDFKLPKQIVYGLLTFSTLTLILVFTCMHHKLYYTSMDFVTTRAFPHLVLGKGVMYYAFMAVTLLTMLGFIVIVIKTIYKQKGQEKKRLMLLLLTGMAPTFALVLNLAPVLKGFDPTPIGLLISCVLITYNVEKYGLLDTMQLASENVMEVEDRGLVVVSKNGNLEYANKKAMTLFSELKKANPDEADMVTVLFGGISQNNIEKKNIVINNVIYEIDYSVLRERKGDTEQGISGYMAWIFDVTSEYNYTRELEHLRHEAEEANAAKTMFLARMSHEIRTPMNGIIGFADLALENDLDSETREYVEYIKNSSNTLLGIINDVLDISKIESGKMEIIELQYSPKKMFEEVAAVLETQAEAKKLQFNLNISNDIPFLVFGDRKRFAEILTNILGNAIKYTKKGKVDFNIKLNHLDEERAVFEIHVIDTGIGIKKEKLDKIFDSFEQLDIVENYQVEGTGLGLSIAKQLTELMGGEITIESQYGKGSDFCIIIPQRLSASNEEHEPGDITDHGAMLIAPDVNALIVDDNNVNLKVEKKILEKYSMMVSLANSGKECLEMIKNEKYDLILMDHRMPGMDGLDTMKAIKKQEGLNKDTPIILVTANTIVGVKEEMLKEGFHGFVSKPIIKKELSEELIRILPAEKVRIVKKAEQEKQKEENMELMTDKMHNSSLDMEEALAQIEIEAETGMKYCGETEFYKEIMKICIASAPDKIKTLKESLENKNYNNFTIVVHSVKSNMANIGAMKLSEAARELEMAGKRDDFVYIDSHAFAFFDYYKDTMDKMADVLNRY